MEGPGSRVLACCRSSGNVSKQFCRFRAASGGVNVFQQPDGKSISHHMAGVVGEPHAKAEFKSSSPVLRTAAFSIKLGFSSLSNPIVSKSEPSE